jgi:hypothetical protein
MPRPLLPPKGVFIPTFMIYHRSLPPSLLQTWVQLRGLAWGRTVTPCMPFKEIAAIIGKSPSTLYRHMSQLRNLAALSWRTTVSGSIIVSFSQQPSNPPSGNMDGITLNSQNRELPSHSSIPILNSDSRNNSEKDHKVLDIDLRYMPELKGEGEFEGGRAGTGMLDPPNQPVPHKGGSRPAPTQYSEPGLSSATETLHAGPVAAYRSLVHLTPNSIQRRILAERVSDLPLWQRTMEHWLGHGWNPRNLTGMLELYQRGGPEGCRYCRPATEARHQSETPLAHTLAAIQALEDNQEPSPGTPVPDTPARADS